MARGRKADPHQAAKGNPGRRKSAVQKRKDEIARVAKLLEDNAPSDVTKPPALLDQGPLYKAAVAMWQDMAPRLARTHRLSDQHKPIFAMFCVYFAEWVRLNDQLAREGDTQTVETVAGGPMIRRHPAVQMRERAFDNVLKLSQHFGLTPHDEYDLFKDQALAAASSPGLFGGLQPAKDKAEPTEAEGPHVGMLGQRNSEPPPTVQ